MNISSLLMLLAIMTLGSTHSWAQTSDGIFCDGFENCGAGTDEAGYLLFRHSQTEIGPFGLGNCDSPVVARRRLYYQLETSGPCNFYGGVNFRHGVFLKEMRCWFDDHNADRQVDVRLERRDLNSGDAAIEIFSLSSPSDGFFSTATDTTASNPQVDNSNYLYSVAIDFLGDEVSTLAFRGCAIKYDTQE